MYLKMLQSFNLFLFLADDYRQSSLFMFIHAGLMYIMSLSYSGQK